MIAARAIAVALMSASPAVAGDVYIVRPLPRDIVGAVQVETIDVTVSAAAEAAMMAHEAKAAAAANAANVTNEANLSDEANPSNEAPGRPAYAALPFTRMAPLVFADTMRAWGLTTGRPVTLQVAILDFGTGNFGRAMLPGGTRDIVSGLVEVTDARVGKTIGMFTVRVVNRYGGWTSMLLRGGRVREKLVEEFARDTARVLAARKSMRAKAKRN